MNETNMETYKIRIMCSNCTYGKGEMPSNWAIADIPKGTLAKKHLEAKKCPTCNCNTLIKKL